MSKAARERLAFPLPPPRMPSIRPAGGPRGVDRLILRAMLRRLTALGLALGHLVLFSGATWLHNHGPEADGIDLAKLPAQYHHHDFGYATGGDEPTPAHDDCIGCRLERTVALPLQAAYEQPESPADPGPTTVPLTAATAEPLEHFLPRAPPLA